MNVTEAVETLRLFLHFHHTLSCSFTPLVICASVYSLRLSASFVFFLNCLHTAILPKDLSFVLHTQTHKCRRSIFPTVTCTVNRTFFQKHIPHNAWNQCACVHMFPTNITLPSHPYIHVSFSVRTALCVCVCVYVCMYVFLCLQTLLPQFA